MSWCLNEFKTSFIMGINSLYVRSSKKWICKTCDLSFKNSLGRLYHLRSHHSEFLKHCCHECGLKCETESAVQSHTQRKHRKQSKAKDKDSLLDLQKLRRRSKCMYCNTRFLNEFLQPKFWFFVKKYVATLRRIAITQWRTSMSSQHKDLELFDMVPLVYFFDIHLEWFVNVFNMTRNHKTLCCYWHHAPIRKHKTWFLPT